MVSFFSICHISQKLNQSTAWVMISCSAVRLPGLFSAPFCTLEAVCMPQIELEREVVCVCVAHIHWTSCPLPVIDNVPHYLCHFISGFQGKLQAGTVCLLGIPANDGTQSPSSNSGQPHSSQSASEHNLAHNTHTHMHACYSESRHIH